MRQFAKLLKKFHVNNGDVILLKHQSANANERAINGISKAIAGMGVNVVIIVVDNFDDLTVLNETEMSKRGWYRMRSLRKIMRPNAPEERETDD